MRLTKGQIKRHKLIYGFFKLLLTKPFSKRYNFTFEKSGLPDAPYIILPNHNTELDPLFIAFCFPHTYFVASEHLFNKGFLSKLLTHFFSPIPRMKSRADVTTVLDIRRRLNQGCNICIFPEGDRSLDGRTARPHPSTGALIKSCKVPFVTYMLEGSFLTHPRWSLGIRRGKMTGRVVNIHYPEQFAGMTPEEINDVIYKDTYDDAYKTQNKQMIQYKGKNLAEGLESALYLCPNCGRPEHLRSEKNHIFCECGMSAKYNEYGYFESDDIGIKNFTEWYDWQRAELYKMAEDAYSRFFVSDNGFCVYKIDTQRRHVKLPQNSIKMNRQQIILSDENGEKIVIDNSSVSGLSIYSRNCLLLLSKQDYYEIKPYGDKSRGFNARKYLHLYEFSKKENTNEFLK